MLKQIFYFCAMYLVQFTVEEAVEEHRYSSGAVLYVRPQTNYSKTDPLYKFYKSMATQAIKRNAPELLIAKYVDEAVARTSKLDDKGNYYFTANVTDPHKNHFPEQKWLNCMNSIEKLQGSSEPKVSDSSCDYYVVQKTAVGWPHLTV